LGPGAGTVLWVRVTGIWLPGLSFLCIYKHFLLPFPHPLDFYSLHPPLSPLPLCPHPVCPAYAPDSFPLFSFLLLFFSPLSFPPLFSMVPFSLFPSVTPFRRFLARFITPSFSFFTHDTGYNFTFGMSNTSHRNPLIFFSSPATAKRFRTLRHLVLILVFYALPHPPAFPWVPFGRTGRVFSSSLINDVYHFPFFSATFLRSTLSRRACAKRPRNWRNWLHFPRSRPHLLPFCRDAFSMTAAKKPLLLFAAVRLTTHTSNQGPARSFIRWRLFFPLVFFSHPHPGLPSRFMPHITDVSIVCLCRSRPFKTGAGYRHYLTARLYFDRFTRARKGSGTMSRLLPLSWTTLGLCAGFLRIVWTLPASHAHIFRAGNWGSIFLFFPLFFLPLRLSQNLRCPSTAAAPGAAQSAFSISDLFCASRRCLARLRYRNFYAHADRVAALLSPLRFAPAFRPRLPWSRHVTFLAVIPAGPRDTNHPPLFPFFWHPAL